MFNRKAIMTAAWNAYRIDAVRAAAHGFKPMSFAQQLKDAWMAAKIAVRNAARRTELAAMPIAKAIIESELDLAVYLPRGRSYLAHVDALRTELANL